MTVIATRIVTLEYKISSENRTDRDVWEVDLKDAIANAVMSKRRLRKHHINWTAVLDVVSQPVTDIEISP